MTAFALDDLDQPDWLAALARIGTAEGFYRELGPLHSALFVQRSPKLLVSFEASAELCEAVPDQLPVGLRMSAREGWSSLTLLSHGDRRFRDQAVTALFDGLSDEGFFDMFDQLLFFGADHAGHAACAYSLAAAGARVLALRPVATCAPELASWDDRDRPARRLDFTSRYGYGPAMLDAAERAWVIYDPHEALDAMHAALYAQAPVTRLRAPFLGVDLGLNFRRMGLLEPLIATAMADELDQPGLSRLLRARHDHMAYLRHLTTLCQDAGRDTRVARICSHALRHGERSFFRERLRAAEGRLAHQHGAPIGGQETTQPAPPAPLS